MIALKMLQAAEIAMVVLFVLYLIERAREKWRV